MGAMTENETMIRKAYKIADEQDVAGWAGCSNEDGTLTNESIGVTYRARKEVGIPVRIFATAFPDMHRDLQNVYVTGDVVVVDGADALRDGVPVTPKTSAQGKS